VTAICPRAKSLRVETRGSADVVLDSHGRASFYVRFLLEEQPAESLPTPLGVDGEVCGGGAEGGSYGEARSGTASARGTGSSTALSCGKGGMGSGAGIRAVTPSLCVGLCAGHTVTDRGVLSVASLPIRLLEEVRWCGGGWGAAVQARSVSLNRGGRACANSHVRARARAPTPHTRRAAGATPSAPAWRGAGVADLWRC